MIHSLSVNACFEGFAVFYSRLCKNWAVETSSVVFGCRKSRVMAIQSRRNRPFYAEESCPDNSNMKWLRVYVRAQMRSGFVCLLHGELTLSVNS